MQQPITKAWCAENPDRYRQLAQPPDCCPICMEAFSEYNEARSPLTGDCASTCRHWACETCWLRVMDGHPGTWRCPYCREDLRMWMGVAFADVYCPPPDAIGVDEIRRFAAEVLQRMDVPSDLAQLARRILRHV